MCIFILVYNVLNIIFGILPFFITNIIVVYHLFREIYTDLSAENKAADKMCSWSISLAHIDVVSLTVIVCLIGEPMMSISELLGLNLPRGPLLGNTSPLGGSSHFGSPTSTPSNPFHRSYQASIQAVKSYTLHDAVRSCV